ncbi:MAG TPA: sulfite exporter TauE/SafE family protein [Micropepsaceae bacterium]|nr:sulfite exporter TauE/SafE family protein [Micropepsaceae bacterium]
MIAGQIATLVPIGFLAGICNALVGGGTLFTFPTLLAAGLPPVLANTTTTVALWPGAMTSAFAYRAQLDPMRKELPPRIVVAIVGGLAGAILLLASGNAFFFYLVPWLLAVATLLFTFSPQIVKRSAELAHGRHRKTRLLVMEFLSAIYGGYFGAAVGILLLAGMAVSGEEDMQSTNAQRNFLVCFINGVAVLLFVGTGVVDWRVALIVMAGSIAGGYFGARVARRIPNPLLRLIITAAGAVFSVYYFVQAYG